MFSNDPIIVSMDLFMTVIDDTTHTLKIYL